MAEYYCLSKFTAAPRTEGTGTHYHPRIEALCVKCEARDADAAKGWGAYLVTDPTPEAFSDPDVILAAVDHTQTTIAELVRLRPQLAEFGITLSTTNRSVGRGVLRAFFAEKGFR